MRKTRLALSLALALSGGTGLFGNAGAQELPWLKSGRIRLDFTPSFWAWSERYGTASSDSPDPTQGVEPLGMDLTGNPLGKEVLPYLAPLEASLQAALQDPAYRVRLGASQAVVEQSRLVFPFRLEMGVTDWLTVGAMVPLVRPRTELTFAMGADSLSGDMGLTPTTGAFLSGFGQVLDNAEAMNPGHSAVVEARAYLDALTAAYTHGSVFPVVGSTSGTQLQLRLDELKAALEAAGFTGVPETVPLAQGYLTEEGFNSLLTSPAMQGTPLGNWTTPWVLGDVELTAAARVLSGGFEPDSLGELPALRYQLGVGGLVRLGTGAQADPNRFLDTDPADGQADVEGTVFGLAEIGSRFGAWAQARYGIQREGTVIRRVALPSETLPPLSRQIPVYRKPGNYFQLDLNPRFFFTPEMSFGLRYRYWAKGQDRYSLPEIDPEVLAALNLPGIETLNYETEERLQELGVSVTYSTLGPHGRGESPIPLHVRFTFLRPLDGSGGQTPKGARFEAGLSVYRALWGRGGNGGESGAPGNR